MTRTPFAADAAADVAWCMACQFVRDCHAGADADRTAELIAAVTPYLQQAIFAYWECQSDRWHPPVPSAN